MAEVKLRGVKKSFDEVEVIHGVDLEIKDQEFVVFVGPPDVASQHCYE